MNIGDKAPEILGLDQDGNEVRLADFAGKRLALYFYPKDSTPGCTSEACNLRDNHAQLQAAGFEVIGVSVDDAKKHKKFIEKNNLPFRLIADTEHSLVNQFGVWGEKTLCGRKYMGTFRTTFIIAPDGTIERVFSPKDIKVKDHARQILP